MNIPILDFAQSNDFIVTELRRALEDVGFFAVVNHGIDWAGVEAIVDANRRYHARPLAKKLASAFNASFAGYLAQSDNTIRTSDLNENDKGDLNAAFFMERDRVPDGIQSPRARAFRSPNQWPDDMPGFKDTVSGYYQLMEGFGARLLPLYARALGLPEDYFDAAFRWPQASLRLSHYPPAQRADNQFGIAPHTDAGFLTILPQSDVMGLHIRPPNGAWTAAPRVEQGFFINSGDMLKRWTNDRFLSTQHMAINEAGIDRYATVFFYSPDLEFEMACLPTCQGPDNPPKYPPITYGQYRDWFMNANYRDGVQDRPADPA
jgi:isopenicillin N synthase-like dioxygenase